MNPQLEFLLTILSSSGIVALILWIFKKRITSGIENSIKHKYDKKIEAFKNEFTNSQTLLINSLSNQLEGNKGTIKKRIKTIDLFWSDIVLNQEIIRPLNTIDTILTIDEAVRIKKSKPPSNESLRILIEHAFRNNLINMSKKITKNNEKLEILRPYIGNDLWLLRHYYNLFIGRVFMLYHNSYNNEKIEQHWSKDKYLKDAISEILTQSEIQYIYQEHQGGIDRAIGLFKENILIEIRKILTGATASENSIKIAMLLSEKINKK